jgi:putative ABC transport system substrate-binding protein
MARDQPAYWSSRRRFCSTLAGVRGLPTMAYDHVVAQKYGALIAYSATRDELFRRRAENIDRILRGAKPADLPVRQPTKFELVINLKAAKALSLTIPQSLLLRADEVIQ